MKHPRLRRRAAWARAFLFPFVALSSLAFGTVALAGFSGGARDDQSASGTQADFVRVLPLAANDVIYNPADLTLYASVPSAAGAAGNSIVPVNPATGEIGTPVFVGSEPDRLALSDDGHTLYVGLDGAFAVRRFDTKTKTAGIQFGIGTASASDMDVMPGSPGTLAVSRGTTFNNGVAIFDDGVQRPKASSGSAYGIGPIEFGATPSVLYGYDSFSSGFELVKFNVDATGVTQAYSASGLISGYSSSMKFAGGRLYSSTGAVVDPEAKSLLGTFPNASSTAFALDTAVGRAYYLTGGNFGSVATLTLRAYDINTFVLLGSTTISGVNGSPTTLVRWGSNGLAFRTSANQIYLVQTSLIPSADPIPTPTPTPAATPTPTPPATFVRQVPLTTNDLIYDPQNQLLYASVPSSAGSPRGNSVTRIDPSAGQIGSSTFVGSEPGRLALADDNQTMYVALNGAGAVRRFDASSQTAGLQFSLGNATYDGPFKASDISVMPGSPGTVAVSRYTSGESGTVIYDNGVARAQKGTTGGDIEFGTASRLYAGSSSVTVYSVAAGGLTSVKTLTTTSGAGSTRFAGGLLYYTNGAVIDPESGEIKGRFGGNTITSDSTMAVDTAQGRAYFMGRDSSTGQWVLRSFELGTFRQLASVAVRITDSGSAMSLVRWGSNGLAFRTTNNVYLVQSALVDTADPIPTPTPTPSATPTPTPPYVATLVRKVDLAANDLVINPSDQKLYVSVPGAAGASGNSIATIDPATGDIGPSTFVGSEPDRLALSDDGHTLYVGIDGAKAVRRFDTQTKTAGIQFGVGADIPYDMDVMPGSPGTLAVSHYSNFSGGVALYDDGAQRPNASSGGACGIGPIEFSANASSIYGYDVSCSGYFIRFAVDATGVKPAASSRGFNMGPSMRLAGGRLYGSSGVVIDPESMTQFGSFSSGPYYLYNSLVTVDTTLGRVFFLSGGTGSNFVLSAYDINTFLPLGSVTLPVASGTPRGLVRWGSNGLAFCTYKPTTDTSSTSAVYLVQSSLVSDAPPIPSAFQFSTANYSGYESTAPSNGVTVTVTRTGGLSGTASVNYATGGGTATPGADYTATSGTLTFADGETTKTFVVPILDDNIYEGNETVGLTLSSPSSGTLLGAQSTATITIIDNESRPSVSPVSVSVPEGDTGTTPVSLTVRLTNATTQTVTVNYKTTDGTATAPSDYVAATGTLTYAPGETVKTIPLQIVGDKLDEGNESFFVDFSGAVNADAYQRATVTILDDDHPTVQFSAASFTANEGDGRAQITVKRTGITDAAATVNYTTIDDPRPVRCDDNVTAAGAAFARCDYATVAGTLTFAPGETQKSFSVPLVDDGYAEPAEFVRLQLSAPTGASLAAPSTATLTIFDNDSADQPNPLDAADFFVRQQYLDFLSREPEAGQPWTNVLNNCAAGDASCDRVTVSAAFFGSPEFQTKGLFVFKFYKVALARMPRYAEAVADMAAVTGGSTAEVVAKKAAYTTAFAQRAEFRGLYDALTNQQFVDALMGRYNLQAITTINPASPDDAQAARVPLTRADLVAQLTAGTLTRAQVVRAVADSNEVNSAEYNPAFVAMQYFGYLRRDPEAAGYSAWLNAINANPSDTRTMVNGFVNSQEYRMRFGKP